MNSIVIIAVSNSSVNRFIMYTDAIVDTALYVAKNLAWKKLIRLTFYGFYRIKSKPYYLLFYIIPSIRYSILCSKMILLIVEHQAMSLDLRIAM